MKNDHKFTQNAWQTYWERYSLDDINRIISYKTEIYELYDRLLGDVSGKTALEIGGGTGRISLHLAKKGAKVTLLDSSPTARQIQKQYFEAFDQPYTDLDGDFVTYTFDKTYDVIHSEGFLEHFDPDERRGLVQKMLSLLNPGGLLLIMVPNQNNLFFRAGKWVFEHTGQWEFGTEFLMGLPELEDLYREFGVQNVKTGGVFVLSSWNWLIPVFGFNFKVKFRFLDLLRKLRVQDVSTNRLYATLGRQVAIVGTKE